MILGIKRDPALDVDVVAEDHVFLHRSVVDARRRNAGAQSLDDLVSAGYMREIPTDPITEQKEWNIEVGEDPYSSEGGSGIRDIRSTSSEALFTRLPGS